MKDGHKNTAYERFQVQGPKDITLFVKSIGEKKSPNKLIILHDLLDYHQCYLDIGNKLFELSKKNMQIIWMDLRGHGLSTGNRFNCDYFDDYCQDLISVIHHMIEEGDKVSLMGQGLGGLVILRTIQAFSQRLNSKVDKLILSNPLLRMRLEPPAVGRKFLGRLSGGLGKLFLPVDFESRILTHDPIKSEVFVKDPLIGRRITYNFYQEILRISSFVRQEVYYINRPSYLMVGKNDYLTDADTTLLFTKGLSEDISQVEVFSEGEHDLFNDICRDESINKLYDWIKG